MVDAEEEEVDESEHNVDCTIEHVKCNKHHVLFFTCVIVGDPRIVRSQVPVAHVDVASQISATQSLLEDLCCHSIDNVGVLIWLVQVQQSSLLLEVISIETVDEMEVVCDEEEDACPLQLARSIHSKDDHETEKLHHECRLQDGVIS